MATSTCLSINPHLKRPGYSSLLQLHELDKAVPGTLGDIPPISVQPGRSSSSTGSVSLN